MPIINFLNLFDGETLNDWNMTGKGSFAYFKRECTPNTGRDGLTMILQKEIQRFYFGTRMEDIL